MGNRNQIALAQDRGLKSTKWEPSLEHSVILECRGLDYQAKEIELYSKSQ